MDITSISNPKIKRLLALEQKSSLRRESSLFVVEGTREIQHCINAGYQIDTLFICPEIVSHSFAMTDLYYCNNQNGLRLPHPKGFAMTEAVIASEAKQSQINNESRNPSIFEVSKEVYSKVAYREGTEGIIAIVKYKEKTLSNLTLGNCPLVVVLEGVEKPGNIGAVLRSCDAAKVDALIICDPKTDIYNPNLIRASLGAVFTVPIAVCTSEEAIQYLNNQGIKILTAQLQDSALYYDCDMREACALVMGTESTGLTNAWREAATAHIRIPMLGCLDSLNVSVSTAILIFEALRQRI